jgi:multiple sugar transport system substrate-binding protein
MKKFLTLTITLFLLMSMVFTGCTSDVDSNVDEGSDSKDVVEQSQEDKPSDEKITLEFWTMQRHDMEFMQEQIDIYNKTNTDNVFVEYQVMSDDFDTNIDLAFQSNQMPDLFKVSALAVMVNTGMARPIDEYITEDIEKRWGDVLKLEGINMFDGEIYSLPREGTPMRLIYNKDVFEAAGLDPEMPPKTMAEVVEYAKTITEKLSGEGIFGFAMNLKSAQSSLYRSVEEVSYISGEWPYDKASNSYDFTGFGEVTKYFAEMYREGYMFPGVEGLDIDPLRAQFAEGKIGMYMSGSWEIGVYDSQFPTEQKWAATQLPTLTGEVKGTSDLWSAGASFAISSSTEYPDEAWNVINYVLSDELLVQYQELGYGTSVVPSVIEKAGAPDLYGAEYFKVIESDAIQIPWPHRSGMVVEGQSHYDVFAGIILGDDPIDEAVESAVAELNEKYNAAVVTFTADNK